MKKSTVELVREGKYAVEVPVELIEEEGGWSPYFSLEDAKKLEAVRAALRQGDVTTKIRPRLGLRGPPVRFRLSRPGVSIQAGARPPPRPAGHARVPAARGGAGSLGALRVTAKRRRNDKVRRRSARDVRQ